MHKLDFFWSLKPDNEKLEDALTAWLNDSSATGNKTLAIKMIKLHDRDLMIANLRLNKLFPEIGLLKDIVGLHLGGFSSTNCITTLPTEIGRLRNLRDLNLNNNKLSQLPTEIGRLKNLTQLALKNNQLKSLPSEITQLTSLKVLDFSGNQFSSFPAEIAKLTLLDFLDFSNNQISSFPTQVIQLTFLDRLDFSNNPFSSFPTEIFRLTSLWSLNCSLLQLTAVAAEIGQLSKLTILNLSSNKLTSLPAEISHLIKLKFLYLNNNNLLSLPLQMDRLTELAQLQIENNPQLSHLPMCLGNLPYLSNLEIDNTAIPNTLKEAILLQCRMLREHEAIELLPLRISKWKTYGESTAVINCDRFTDNQIDTLNEWLLRLENTADFAASQTLLAQTVCRILEGLENSEFKELFFSQAAANNACCEDRAAMSLNEIYTSWLMIYKSSPPSILQGVAKTLRLRKTLQKLIQKQNPQERESVEIFLYYETRLREVLQLETAIRSMSHASIGCRDWIDQNALIHDVQENFYEELIDLPLFSNWDNEEFHAKLENLGECPPGGEDDPQVLAYKARQGEIMAEWRNKKVAHARKVCNE